MPNSFNPEDAADRMATQCTRGAGVYDVCQAYAAAEHTECECGRLPLRLPLLVDQGVAYTAVCPFHLRAALAKTSRPVGKDVPGKTHIHQVWDVPCAICDQRSRNAVTDAQNADPRFRAEYDRLGYTEQDAVDGAARQAKRQAETDHAQWVQDRAIEEAAMAQAARARLMLQWH
jgi:hypothetical protein